MLVGAPEEYLRHVKKHDDHHAIRAPVMQGAQEPSEFLLVVQDFKGVIGFGGGRNVDERQQDPSDDLDRKAEQSHAPENVKPACAALRNWMAAGRFPDFDQV